MKQRKLQVAAEAIIKALILRQSNLQKRESPLGLRGEILQLITVSKVIPDLFERAQQQISCRRSTSAILRRLAASAVLGFQKTTLRNAARIASLIYQRRFTVIRVISGEVF
jgi:hypothetical protein